MKIFLAGGTGVVGSRALSGLAAAGHHVSAVARNDAKADLVRRLGGEPVAVDLFDGSAVEGAVAGHEVVVNLATHIPPISKAARSAAWDTNERLRTEASAHLVDGALATGATRYVQESICFPYVDDADRWIDEDHPVTHEGPFHGAAAAEQAAHRFAAGGGEGVVLRFAQFYAPESSHTQTFNTMVRRRVNPFLGDPEGYTSFVHADDAGSAVVAALQAPSDVYNVVDDEPVTHAEAGRIVAAALGVKPPRTVPKVVRAATPASAKLLMRSLRVSHDRFSAATGWQPSHRSIRDGWATVVDR
jgi:nucleoside-diphosphate-sugar epimerase